MTKDKWLDLIDRVEANFGIEERFKKGLGDDLPGEKEVIVFKSDALGKVKLEWVEKPRMLDEKTIYSRRIGSDVKVEKVYDEHDVVSYLKAYRWDGASQDWQEIEAQKTFNF